jgi:hypothetical protein
VFLHWSVHIRSLGLSWVPANLLHRCLDYCYYDVRDDLESALDSLYRRWCQARRLGLASRVQRWHLDLASRVQRWCLVEWPRVQSVEVRSRNGFAVESKNGP